MNDERGTMNGNAASAHVPRSSFRLHRYEQRVAQLVAHVFRVHGVEGSSPSTLTECADSLNAQVAERQLRRPVEPLAIGLRGFESLPAH